MSNTDPLADAFLFRALMDDTPDSVYVKDRQCRLVRVSRSMAQRLGCSDPDALIGRTDVDLFGEAFGQRTYLEDQRIMASGEPLVGLIESRSFGDAQVNWTMTTKLPLRNPDGEIIGLMGITREINELKRTELNLQHLATHDGLTNLPNRFLMIDRLSQVLAHAKRTSTTFAVLFVDVDDFKAINDAHGHEFGDLVLQAIAKKLVTSIRASDTVARIGGDEFVVILEETAGQGSAPVVAAKLIERLARPFVVRGRQVTTSVSIGVGVYPDNGADPEVLVRSADYAMYLAKRAGKNRWQTCPDGLPGVDADRRAG